MSWEDQDEDSENEFDIDLSAHWVRDRNNVDLLLRSKYKRKNGETDTNSQTVRGLWFHDYTPRWFAMGQIYAERDTVDIQSFEDIDYLLVKGMVGAGLRYVWNERGYSRFALGFNRFVLEILDPHARAYTSAGSIYIENRFALLDRVTVKNWINIYAWEQGDSGFDSETEFAIDLTDHLQLGLRHRYRDSAATLESDYLHQFKIFTRLQF